MKYLGTISDSKDLVTKQYVDNLIEEIPTPDVSGQIATHNTSITAHADIRSLIAAPTLHIACDISLTGIFTLGATPTPAQARAAINAHQPIVVDVNYHLAPWILNLQSANSTNPLVMVFTSADATDGGTSLRVTMTAADDNTWDSDNCTFEENVGNCSNVILDLNITSSVASDDGVIIEADNTTYNFSAAQAQIFYEQLCGALDENGKVVKNVVAKVNESELIGAIVDNYLPCTVVVSRIIVVPPTIAFKVSFFSIMTDGNDFKEYNLNVSNAGGNYTASIIRRFVVEDTTSNLATVATTGDYEDLINIPTVVSSFTNDAGYLTTHQDISGKQNISIIDTGSYFTTDTVEGALQELGAAKTTVTIKRW